MWAQWPVGSTEAAVRWYIRQAKLSPEVTDAVYCGAMGKVAHGLMHAAMVANWVLPPVQMAGAMVQNEVQSSPHTPSPAGPACGQCVAGAPADGAPPW